MKLLIAGALVASLFATPAIAGETKPRAIKFEAPFACSVSCPHWATVGSEREALEAACLKNPLSPPGSWDDHRVKVPSRVGSRRPVALVFRLAPALEYDGFVCRVHSPGSSRERYSLGSTSANTVTEEDCTAAFLGCKEELFFPVRPGQVLVLRAYNWSDGPTCAGSYSWLT